MFLTVAEFAELVNKVAQSRSAYTRNSPNATWHPDDLAVLFSTISEDVGLTLSFAESMGLLKVESTDEK